MVRAILKGRKKQTRRAVKRQPLEWLQQGFDPEFVAHPENQLCPYGQPGDRLWVRKSWQALQKWDALAPRHVPEETDKVRYAEGAARNSLWAWGKLRPSIFMPRWASRILLEIVSVRVERLQDISEQDALAEGVARDENYPTSDDATCFVCLGDGVHAALGQNYGVTEIDCRHCDTAKKRFGILWERINCPESWNVNPWVWVVEFKRWKGNGKPILLRDYSG